MKRAPFVSILAMASLLAAAACVSSSSSPNPPAFDGGGEWDGSGGSSGSSGSPDASDAAPGRDGSSSGDPDASDGGASALRSVYVVGNLRDPLPDGGPVTGIFGYTVDTTTGVISGTPTTLGTSNVTISAIDAIATTELSRTLWRVTG